MMIVFFLCCGLIVLLGSRKPVENVYTTHSPGLFRTSRMFNILSFVVIAILIAFYWFWW